MDGTGAAGHRLQQSHRRRHGNLVTAGRRRAEFQTRRIDRRHTELRIEFYRHITPIVIGALVDATGSFVVPLAVIGVIALVGAFNYLVILGKGRTPSRSTSLVTSRRYLPASEK
jgi:hypothetical protein